MKRWIKFTLGTVTAIALGAGAYLWEPLPEHADTGPYERTAKDYDVEILRDRWGVPHIVGKRDADAAFGLAYAHAEDDFETIQEVVLATRGRLARYRGVDAAKTDYLVALMDVWGVVDRHYEQLSPAARALAQGYADGLNWYAARHLDQVAPGVLPFSGRDVVAGMTFKSPLFYGLDKHILELFGSERAQEIALAPDSAQERGRPQGFFIRDRGVVERGSNGLAVNRARSSDGKVRLIVNSHQPYDGAVAWYEAHLKSEEGLDVAGGLFPGSPLILHGFNRHLGWASTVNKPDLADVYVLTLNPDNPSQYKLDGEWRDFEVSEVDIAVRLWGPFVWHERREVLRSVHGPVVISEHGAYALRYAGMGEFRHLEQYYAMNKATTFEEWRAAMRLNHLPSINQVYADKAGNIGFFHNAQFPDRPLDLDWKKYLPGDRSYLIWERYIPFDDHPQLINPSSGFVFSANNQPFTATDGPDNLRRSQFRAALGLQTNETNRSLRVMELVRPGQAISGDDLLRIKFDKRYSPRSAMAQVIAEILAMDWSGDDRMSAAAAHLARWNFAVDVDNEHAALGVLAGVKAAMARTRGEPDDVDLGQEFRAAATLLLDSYGRLDVPWGTVNRLIRGDVDLAVGGGPDTLRAIYTHDPDEGGRLRARAGDTYIAFVEWDEDGAITAKTIHQYGVATNDESSPHYSDQAGLYAREQFKPFVMDIAELERDVSRRYRPGQEK